MLRFNGSVLLCLIFIFQLMGFVREKDLVALQIQKQEDYDGPITLT